MGFKKGHKTNIGKTVNYQTGRYKTQEGYVKIWSGFNKKEYEHKMIFQLFHMCCLLPNSIVHHINGIKDDNRIENLDLTSRSKHVGIHKPRLGR